MTEGMPGSQPIKIPGTDVTTRVSSIEARAAWMHQHTHPDMSVEQIQRMLKNPKLEKGYKQALGTPAVVRDYRDQLKKAIESGDPEKIQKAEDRIDQVRKTMEGARDPQNLKKPMFTEEEIEDVTNTATGTEDKGPLDFLTPVTDVLGIGDDDPEGGVEGANEALNKVEEMTAEKTKDARRAEDAKNGTIELSAEARRFFKLRMPDFWEEAKREQNAGSGESAAGAFVDGPTAVRSLPFYDK
jgi:hypothetical protein